MNNLKTLKILLFITFIVASGFMLGPLLDKEKIDSKSNLINENSYYQSSLVNSKHLNKDQKEFFLAVYQFLP